MTGFRWFSQSLIFAASVAELAVAFSVWSEGGRSEGLWSNTIVPAPGSAAPAPAESRLRARFARPSAPTSEEFVIFIEDVRDVEDRAQQLTQRPVRPRGP
jgi:hypothetical protein